MSHSSVAPNHTDESLRIQDYLDASGDATKRTRRVLLTMVVASVIASVGVLNSLPNSWQKARLKKLWTLDDSYVTDLINTPAPADKIYQFRYQQLFAAVSRSYAETTSIQIPFFGIAIDINDLGLLCGFSFVIILIWFWLCVRSEIENLNLSFMESRKLHQLPDFYRLLAMRQVLIIPWVPGRTRNRFYWVVPLLICALPAVTYAGVLAADLATKDIGYQLDRIHTKIVLGADWFFIALIFLLAVFVFLRWLQLDRAWTWYWCEYVVLTETASKSLLSQANHTPKDLIEEALKGPREKLEKKKLERTVLSQLFTAADGSEVKIYKYFSGNITLIIETFKGKLKELKVDEINAAAIRKDSVDRSDQIRTRAYEIYEQNGRRGGCAEQDWLKAEAEILRPGALQAAKATA